MKNSAELVKEKHVIKDDCIVMFSEDKWLTMAEVKKIVNACAGINPEAVPEMYEGIVHAIFMMEHAERYEQPYKNAIEILKTALAKATGKGE